MARERGLVIAIDGPSGAGKSTAGRALAERLGYTFVDTGAMYRALALKAIEHKVDLTSEESLAALARETRIELVSGGRSVSLDGREVTSQIRSREVSVASSRISVHPGVRRDMVARQREMGRAGGIVLDGRDIGTAVFPDADVKFYLDADPTRRAQRRHVELAAAGSASDIHSVERDLRARDHADSTRQDSPLVRAEDAIYLDTTTLIPAEVVERMVAAVVAREPSLAGRTRD
jgi:cytidylate kinase